MMDFFTHDVPPIARPMMQLPKHPTAADSEGVAIPKKRSPTVSRIMMARGKRYLIESTTFCRKGIAST
jgi:hypothetical protein